jgi:formylglycine-generating enzyme required for sulfatase activity
MGSRSCPESIARRSWLPALVALGLLVATNGCSVRNEPSGGPPATGNSAIGNTATGNSATGNSATGNGATGGSATGAGGESAANPTGGATDAGLAEVTTSLGMTMVRIPAGRFTMGSARGAADEQPPHEVELSGFLMDKYEVTQDLLEKLQLPDPSRFKGGRRPVERVRWSDAVEICNERSRAEGLEPCYDDETFECNFDATGYRLPTEAEWEYAARAGSTEDEPLGVALPRLDQQACYSSNSGKQTDVVGKRRPNAWGLYDMRGNVAEWCHDSYQANYYASSPARDPRGPDMGAKRVIRGGAWNAEPASCRLTARRADDPGISDACFARDTHGFRCVRRADGAK